MFINTLYFPFFFILATVLGLLWYLTVVLICISQMINEVDHLIICSSDICIPSFFSLFKKIFNWRLITLQYCSGFCHTSTWISHGCTCVPHPETPSHLPPHPIPQGHPSAPALSTLSHASNLDWQSTSHMVIYMFQCYSLRSSHPRLLPQSPKVCSLHLCLFCCFEYRVIITIFLNSIYMC